MTDGMKWPRKPTLNTGDCDREVEIYVSSRTNMILVYSVYVFLLLLVLTICQPQASNHLQQPGTNLHFFLDRGVCRVLLLHWKGLSIIFNDLSTIYQPSLLVIGHFFDHHVSLTIIVGIVAVIGPLTFRPALTITTMFRSDIAIFFLTTEDGHRQLALICNTSWQHIGKHDNWQIYWLSNG